MFSQLENIEENHQKWLNYLMNIWGDKILDNFFFFFRFPTILWGQ